MNATELIFGILSCIIIVGLAIYYFWHRKNCGIKGKESIYVGVWWLAIFAMGFALHLVYYIGKLGNQSVGGDYLIAIATSAFWAIRLFAFDFRQDGIISEVWSAGASGQFFAIMLIIVFVLAGLWTYYILIATFFRGVVNSFKIWFHKIGFPFKRKSTHYIVIGNGANADVFINSLYAQRKKKNWLYRLFCGDDVTIIIGGVLGGNSKDIFYKYLNKGYAVINGCADLDSLQAAGVNNQKRKTIVVAISDSDEENIAVAEIITNLVAQRAMKVCEPEATDLDAFLKKTVAIAHKSRDENERISLGEKIDRIKLEARIMYTVIDRAEHFDFADNAFGKVNFFNPYELRAQKFFWEHPLTHYIAPLLDYDKARLKGEFNKDGKIINPISGSAYKINNIFIGFGSANYQMLRNSVINYQLLGADYNAIVYAKDIEDVYVNNIMTVKPSVRQQMFMQQSPGLFNRDEKINGKKYFESPKEKYYIDFKHGNVLANDFYESLLSEIEKSDFTSVYIALGDDKTSIETALEIRQMLAERFDLLQNVRIFIKVRNKSAIMTDALINNFRNIPLKVECYGLDEDFLSVENVVAPFIDKLASTLSNQNHNLPWGFSSEFERDSNRSKVLGLREMLGFLGLDITTNQDDAISANEEYRKRYGLNDNDIDAIVSVDASKNKPMRLKYLIRNNDEILDSPRNNLAIREHLRWDTFHYVNGWTKKPIDLIGSKNGEDDLDKYFSANRATEDLGRKNRLTKQHACLTTFKGLIELRKHQALLAGEADKEENYDTIYHDFTMMDKLLERLERVPEIKICKLNQITIQEDN
ncbi:MAG: hypothetical protein HDT28_01185 [Clostridiales bacterium]|nr:hypothetical protein [Clostridiales bacterium]